MLYHDTVHHSQGSRTETHAFGRYPQIIWIRWRVSTPKPFEEAENEYWSQRNLWNARGRLRETAIISALYTTLFVAALDHGVIDTAAPTVPAAFIGSTKKLSWGMLRYRLVCLIKLKSCWPWSNPTDSDQPFRRITITSSPAMWKTAHPVSTVSTWNLRPRLRPGLDQRQGTRTTAYAFEHLLTAAQTRLTPMVSQVFPLDVRAEVCRGVSGAGG